MEEAKRFGARLKELRIQAGLTQRELAKKVNVDFTYLSKIENGVLPPPSEKVILQLDEVLNADKDELMTLAGKIPADIAEILKNREAMQSLRSDSARQKARATREKKTMSISKLSTPIRRLSSIAVPIMLVVAVALSLWYAAPTQALEIAITEPEDGNLGNQHTLTVTMTLEANELVPIQSVNLEIYNVSDETKKATLQNLPQVDSAEQAHTISEGATSGSATVAADANAAWEGSYTTGPGVAYWQGTAYSFGASHGYSYGGELTRITYTVKWTSPSGWPAGSYKIKTLLTVSGPDLTKTFTETSSAFSLTTTAADDSNGGGGVGGTTTVTSTKVEAMTDDAAATTIAKLTDKTAAAVLKDVSTAKAARIMEKLTDAKAASIMDKLTDVKAASILEKLSTNKGAATLEKLTGKKAASIVEKVETKKAATILGKVTARKTAEILQTVTTKTASAIMQELTTEKLNDTIPEMSEGALTERLPGLSPEKLHSVDPEVLFASLPNAPTEQLTGEDPPEPPAELTDPVVVFSTPSGGRYLAIRTIAGEWVIVVGTPEPIEKLLIKTRQALADVGTSIEVYEERPPEVLKDLPDGKIVRAYFKVTFENAEPEDIELGHMTFKIEKEWLEQNSVHKWSVVVDHWSMEDEAWTTLPTKRISEDADDVYYTVAITRFSIFAITGTEAVPGLGFEADNLSISPSNARVGEEVTITADISNLADSEGTYVVTLWVDGTIEAGKEVTLATNEAKPVSFVVSRKAEGDYDIRLARLFGSFSITEEPAPAPAPAPTPAPAPAPPKPPVVTPAPAPAPAPPPALPTPPPAPPVTPTNWWLIGGGIIAVAIIAAVVAWILVARRRD